MPLYVIQDPFSFFYSLFLRNSGREEIYTYKDSVSFGLLQVICSIFIFVDFAVTASVANSYKSKMYAAFFYFMPIYFFLPFRHVNTVTSFFKRNVRFFCFRRFYNSTFRLCLERNFVQGRSPRHNTSLGRNNTNNNY